MIVARTNHTISGKFCQLRVGYSRVEQGVNVGFVHVHKAKQLAFRQSAYPTGGVLNNDDAA